MSEENLIADSSNTLSLSLGGKTIIADISQSKDQYDLYDNSNQVYVDSASLSNSKRAQYEIVNTQTMMIKFGQARVKSINPDYSPSPPSNLPIYLKAYTSADVNASGIKGITAGKGILVKSTQADTPQISIDSSVVALKSDIGGGSSSTVEFNSLELYQLKELLSVVEVIYDQTQQNIFETLQYSDVVDKNTSHSLIGFSVKYTNTSPSQNINCVRIRTNSTTTENVYCVVRKCKTLKESGGGGYIPPTEFIDYLNDSQVISVSKNTMKLDNNHYIWHFPNPFDMGGDDCPIYLITFHNKKTQMWDQNSLTSVEIVANSESSAISDLQYIWDSQFTATQTMPYAIFSHRAPIGTIIKDTRYGS